MKRRLKINIYFAVKAKLAITPSAKAPVPISVNIYMLANQPLHSRGGLLDEKPRIVTGIEQPRVDRVQVTVCAVSLQGLRDRMRWGSGNLLVVIALTGSQVGRGFCFC
jgi:hypothetical protein